MALQPCPVCERELSVKRNRAGGYFIGCTGYPACSYTAAVSDATRLEVTGVTPLFDLKPYTVRLPPPPPREEEGDGNGWTQMEMDL